MPESEKSSHVMRVGWSTDASNFTVGEEPLSYGYGGTGKRSCNNQFLNYGEPFSTNDVITCYIDLEAVPKTIFFTKNGNYLGVAFRLGPEAAGQVFYPHVTVKNMKFVANFGGHQPYFPPVQEFCLLQWLPSHMLILPPACPKERQDCEVLMMVGLPSCGKTTWIQQFVKNHPEKKYNVLGSNDILCKMKVMGLSRKRNYHGRWDALIKQATGILNEMLKVAQRKNRNYILDQTNVYPNARRRKMNNFRGYRHIAVVVVNTNSVLKERNEKVVRKEGKVVPESAIMEMKANFILPVQGEIFDEVWYVEENQEMSQQLVQEFNNEGRMWKEAQKKRPAGEEPLSDMKKPKSETAGNFTHPGSQHGTGYHGSRGRDHVDSSGGMGRNITRSGPNDSYKEAVGFRPGNDSHHRDVHQGKREDPSRPDSYSRTAPPHPSYHQPSYQQPAYQQPAYQQPAYQQPAYQAQQHGLSTVRNEQASSYYPAENRQQQYGQQYYAQPQYHDNPSHYHDNFGREASNWDTAQRPSNVQYQDYYASRQPAPPTAKQDNLAQEQSYLYQGQYGNYQQHQ